MSIEELPERYGRQVLFGPVGAGGQRRLLASRVAVVGCGALGATLGELLARSGVGRILLVDRDVVEPVNLGRQALYTDEDAKRALPKAEALRRHLLDFNPGITVEAHVMDLGADQARDILGDADLVLDGTDNFDTRYLINDLAIARGIPWVYGACVGARGMTATVIPGVTPCLRCLFPEPPPPGSTETCDTAGIIAPAATLVASLQAAEGLKILVGDREAVHRGVVSVELWPFRIVELGADAEPDPQCPACASRDLHWLEGGGRGRSEILCGRGSVQVLPAPGRGRVDLQALERRLAATCTSRLQEFVLQVDVPGGHRLTVFDDGRALVSGTSDPAAARALYDRYVGA